MNDGEICSFGAVHEFSRRPGPHRPRPSRSRPEPVPRAAEPIAAPNLRDNSAAGRVALPVCPVRARIRTPTVKGYAAAAAAAHPLDYT